MTQVGPPDWATTTLRAGMARSPSTGRQFDGRESATRSWLDCDAASRPFPGRSVGQERLEPRHHVVHVGTRVGAGEEPGEGFRVEPAPRLVLVSGVDRVEED